MKEVDQMKIKLIFAIVLIILLVGCKKIPVEEVPGVPVGGEQIEPVKELPSEIVVETAVVDIRLTADKTMEPSEIKISVGTNVRWTNEGIWARNLMIYDANIKDLNEGDIVRSQNILTNESFSYTFDKKGTFTVKDIYTYSIRGTVTVE
jgi:plastocyanin